MKSLTLRVILNGTRGMLQRKGLYQGSEGLYCLPLVRHFIQLRAWYNLVPALRKQKQAISAFDATWST